MLFSRDRRILIPGPMRACRPSVADSARAANPSQLAAVASYPLEDQYKDHELAKESPDPSQNRRCSYESTPSLG